MSVQNVFSEPMDPPFVYSPPETNLSNVVTLNTQQTINGQKSFQLPPDKENLVLPYFDDEALLLGAMKPSVLAIEPEVEITDTNEETLALIIPVGSLYAGWYTFTIPLAMDNTVSIPYAYSWRLFSTDTEGLETTILTSTYNSILWSSPTDLTISIVFEAPDPSLVYTVGFTLHAPDDEPYSLVLDTAILSRV